MPRQPRPKKQGPDEQRREALRALLRVAYTAPVVHTVLLSSCQTGDPSGSMTSSTDECYPGAPPPCPETM